MGVARLFCFQVSTVWLSQSAALGAVHGESRGTCPAMLSSFRIACSASAPPEGSGGTAPRPGVSVLYGSRIPFR